MQAEQDSQNMVKSRTGVICNWDANTGSGVIAVRDTEPLEKYFLWASKIISGTPTPRVGLIVHFEVSPKPAKPGRFQFAINARVDRPNQKAVAVQE